MRRFNIVFFILIGFSFISCSHKKNIKIESNSAETIKQIINEKNSTLIWSNEIEPNRLNEKIIINEEKIAKEVERTPLMVISQNFDCNPVYPELDGFTNLDISAMNESLKKTVNDFCEEFSNKNIFTNIGKFYNSKFVFNSVLFLDDFKLSYEKKIGKFPYKSDSTDEKTGLCSSYIIGKPDISSEFFEIPVRFYCQSKFVDLTLIIKDSVPYEIFDINIVGWEND